MDLLDIQHKIKTQLIEIDKHLTAELKGKYFQFITNLISLDFNVELNDFDNIRNHKFSFNFEQLGVLIINQLKFKRIVYVDFMSQYIKVEVSNEGQLFFETNS